jgi:predicted DNA binding CopG/RHH family protein
MKTVILDKEEKKIERDFDKYQPASREARAQIEKIIEGSRKSRPINFRINENDLERLKEKANRNGLPYQTMINVVIHKFVNDSYIDKDEINKFLQLKKVV